MENCFISSVKGPSISRLCITNRRPNKFCLVVELWPKTAQLVSIKITATVAPVSRTNVAVIPFIEACFEMAISVLAEEETILPFCKALKTMKLTEWPI